MSSTILADTTEDLINALVLKNILTEDEAALLSRQNKGEGKTRSKNVAGKLSISNYLKKQRCMVTYVLDKNGGRAKNILLLLMHGKETQLTEVDSVIK